MAWIIAQKFDVYVIDATMPGESAAGLCGTIRTVDEDGMIICISPTEADREKLLAAGGDLFIKMPEEVGRIRRLIAELLDSSRNGPSI
jgi:DNA-binding response OmpR family regulator